MADLLSLLFAPGIWSSDAVRTALLAGGIVAISSPLVGVFTVIRGQSFAGHSLTDVSTTGGAGASLAGVSPLWGFAVMSVAAAGALELIGIRRPRGRDLATGIVLGAATGVAALFLYLGTTLTNGSGTPMTILFGSLFAVSASLLPAIVLLSVASLLIVGLLYRQLLLTAVSDEIAAARGVPVRAVGLLYLLALALAVSLAAITIGSVLSTALLIGPAATVLRLTKRPGLALLWAAVLGLAATWLGILLAYDSHGWPPSGHGWPVSFFVVAIVFIGYLLSGLAGRVRERSVRQRRRRPPLVPAAGSEGR
ncbi:MAG: metal ABC transporter permease [Candidatus Dormiibacterota bacterium]